MTDASGPNQIEPRQAWMRVLARASGETLERLSAGLLPPFERIRGPELGLVLLQGRAGGVGERFNFGEATVSRCTVRIAAGLVGHAYRLGRDLRAAELAAVIDAALQEHEHHDPLQAAVIRPLAEAQDAAQAQTARRAAATKVQFFTMATMRGDG